MGVPLAHLTLIAPWAAAVGAAPLWLIHRVLDLPNVRAQSRQDGLTELFTAPYLTESCTRELNRGRRFNRPVSLLLLDLDGLGELNATHGHQAGDAMLRGTARTIDDATREYDLAARLAGGAFAVLLPETDLAQAQAVAERVRGLLFGSVVTLALAVCLVGSIAELDWAMLAVMSSLAVLAGLAFYFKSLPLALALVAELHRSSARLWAARWWRMWPQYVALSAAGVTAVFAHQHVGLTGAIAVSAAALLVRHLAGRYVDRTLDSVRKLRTANEQLEHQAFHDPLTKLANRALFAERLEHAMVRAGEGSVAVLFLDMDNF